MMRIRCCGTFNGSAEVAKNRLHEMYLKVAELSLRRAGKWHECASKGDPIQQMIVVSTSTSRVERVA